MELSGLFDLVRERRFGELERRLDEAQASDAAERLELLRLRGELAAEGRGPVTDAVRAAEALTEAGHTGAAEMCERAARLLGRCGARGTARATLERAAARWPEHAGLAMVRRQLEAGRFDADTPAQWEVLALLDRGDVAAARRALEEMLEGDEVHWAGRWLVDLQRAERDFAAAAATFDRCAAASPRGDDAPPLRLAAALARWAAGAPGVVDELRRLREAHGSPPSAHAHASRSEGLAAWVHRRCAVVLESIDRTPEPPAPAWVRGDAATPPADGGVGVGERCPGRAAARLVAARLGLELGELADAGPLTTMAHLRRALESAGAAVVRVALDEERLAAALAAGALVVLEEERSTETAFLVIEDLERRARLVLVRDPARPGPYLRDVEEQWAQSALFGRSALVVGDAGRARLDELAAAGVTHDPGLEALDRCDLDECGRVPQQARIVALAEEARELNPALPLPYKRLGEALLEQMRLGIIPTHRSSAYDGWHAEARSRFPEAEWPHQIHALALELQGRVEEAGIAWADAAACDPYDDRNLLGSARARALLGDRAGADRDLRRALTLRPGNVAALGQRAELLLARGEHDEAAFHADLALDLAPDDAEALLVAATVREQRDDFGQALAMLERAAAQPEREASATLRLARRRMHDGEWDEALRAAERYCALAPDAPLAWGTAALVHWARADLARAFDTAMAGLARCGPDRGVIELAVASAGMLLPPAMVGEALAPLRSELSSTPQALLDVASELARMRLWELAVEIDAEAEALMPQGANAPWRAAQVLLGEDEARRTRREEIEALLGRTIERARGYPPPRVMLGWLVSERDPEQALALVSEADVRQSPALVWSLMASLFERLGRADDAARVRGRLPELYPAGVIDPAAFLRSCGFVEAARELLEGALAAAPGHDDVVVELAAALLRQGEAARALELLAGLERRGTRARYRDLMAQAAIDARDMPTLELLAAATVEAGRRESRHGFFDTWLSQARVAAARLAQGDEAPRRRLLERAGRHPDALLALLLVEEAISHPLAAETRRHAEAVAPGVPRIADRGGFR